jgi:hypothetical protein
VAVGEVCQDYDRCGPNPSLWAKLGLWGRGELFEVVL